MTRTTAMTFAAVVVGFVVGLAWGRSTRESAAGHVKTDISGGVITIKADIKAAASDGLAQILDF